MAFNDAVGGAGGTGGTDPRFTLDEATAAYEAVLTLAAVRLQTLLLMEEHAAARHHAVEFNAWHERTVGGLLAIDIAAARSRRLAEVDGISEDDARTQLLRDCRNHTEGIREVQLLAAGQPDHLALLVERGMSGREYVQTVREAGEPILALAVG